MLKFLLINDKIVFFKDEKPNNCAIGKIVVEVLNNETIDLFQIDNQNDIDIQTQILTEFIIDIDTYTIYNNNIKNFEDFEFIFNTLKSYKKDSIREGQLLMILIGKINVKIYKEITATNIDCFYNDNIIQTTLKFLKNNFYKI